MKVLQGDMNFFGCSSGPPCAVRMVSNSWHTPQIWPHNQMSTTIYFRPRIIFCNCLLTKSLEFLRKTIFFGNVVMKLEIILNLSEANFFNNYFSQTHRFV